MDNRRKIIVINKKFQHQYAMIIVVMTVFLANLFIIGRSLFPGDQPFALTSSVAWTIGIVELILVVGAWYGSLKASHKIAGPVYVFTRQLKAVGAGELWARISLRKGDMFVDEASTINASLDQLQGRVESIKALAGELQQAQAAGGDISPQLDKLMAQLSELHTVREE